jgi:hypothetical protein
MHVKWVTGTSDAAAAAVPCTSTAHTKKMKTGLLSKSIKLIYIWHNAAALEKEHMSAIRCSNCSTAVVCAQVHFSTGSANQTPSRVCSQQKLFLFTSTSW